MRLLLVLSLSFFVISAKAQIEKTEAIFANQGDQENYWAKQIFQDGYKPYAFERFKGKIVSSADSISFDNKTLRIVVSDPILRMIFEKGILYPGIISNYGQSQSGKAVKLLSSNLKKDTSAQTRHSFFEKFESYSISNLEEVSFLSNSPNIKRFRFWLFNKLFSNPEVCFFELTNNAANGKTDLATFINGCNLTFFAHGWIII